MDFYSSKRTCQNHLKGKNGKGFPWPVGCRGSCGKRPTVFWALEPYPLLINVYKYGIWSDYWNAQFGLSHFMMP